MNVDWGLFVMIFKVLFLFIAVWTTIANTMKLIAIIGKVPNTPILVPDILVQAIGVTGFIVLQWLV